jgi:hypothetical protein
VVALSGDASRQACLTCEVDWLGLGTPCWVCGGKGHPLAWMNAEQRLPFGWSGSPAQQHFITGGTE